MTQRTYPVYVTSWYKTSPYVWGNLTQNGFAIFSLSYSCWFQSAEKYLISFSFSVYIHADIATTSWASVCPHVGCSSAGITPVSPRGTANFHTDRQSQTAPALLEILAGIVSDRLKFWCLLVTQSPKRKRERRRDREKPRWVGCRKEEEEEFRERNEGKAGWMIPSVSVYSCTRLLYAAVEVFSSFESTMIEHQPLAKYLYFLCQYVWYY